MFPTSRVCFQGDLPNELEPEWSVHRVTPGKELPNSTGRAGVGGLPGPAAAADCFLPFKWGGGLGFCPVLGLSVIGEICSNELCGFIWGRKLPSTHF